MPEPRRDAGGPPLRHGVRFGPGQFSDRSAPPEPFDDLMSAHATRITDHLLERNTDCLARVRLSVAAWLGTMNDTPIDLDELARAVGQRLRAVMRELEFSTVDEFAALLGASRNQASNWLNGYNCPPVWYMMKLSRRAGLTLDWIYEGNTGALPLAKSIRLEAQMQGVSAPQVAADPPEGRVSPKPVRRKQRAT